MSAKIYQFCPKPSEVVSLAEGHAQARVAFIAAWWRFWFDVWGIR